MLLSHAYADSGVVKEKRRVNLVANLVYNSNSIVTKESDTTISASTTSSFTALQLEGDYFFLPRFAASAKTLISLVSSLDAEIKGVDAGVRYYPSKRGHQTEVELLGSKIETTPGWAGFVYGGFVSRDFQFSNSNISFQGLEAGGGADYHFKNHLFLRGSLNYQMLQNTSSRTLNGFAAGVGFGYSF